MTDLASDGQPIQGSTITIPREGKATLAPPAPRKRTRKPAPAKRPAKKPDIRHSAATHDWGSARVQIDIARAVLGYITVDPFTSAKWNTVIGARRIITAAEDGFVTPWIGGGPAPGVDLGDDDGVAMRKLAAMGGLAGATAFVNAPGDRSGENIKNAWRALELYHRRVFFAGGAVWIGFSMNQLQTLQDLDASANGYRSPLCSDFLRCVPESRIPYQSEPGVDGEQPSHPSWMLLLPAIERRTRERQERAWTALCARLGEVW